MLECKGERYFSQSCVMLISQNKMLNLLSLRILNISFSFKVILKNSNNFSF